MRKIHKRMSIVLSKLQKNEQALNCFQHALTIEPNNERTREAFNDVEKSIKSSPNHTDVKNYYRNSYAVIIGISKYKEESPLPNAYNDGFSIQKTLEDEYGFTTSVHLFNEYATYNNILTTFEDTLQGTKIGPQDRLLVYYAGHGKLRTQIGRRGEEINNGSIIPYDAEKDKYSSYIHMETIIDRCKDCLAKHTLLVLDCCYSGYAAMGSGNT